MICVICHRLLFKPNLSANSEYLCQPCAHGWRVEKMLRSVGAGTRTHLKSRVLWLVFGMGALPVMFCYARSVTILRAHHCCLLRVGKLSQDAILFLLSLATDKMFSKLLFRLVLTITIIKSASGRTNCTCLPHWRISTFCFWSPCSM